MRTTLTLDDDVAKALQETARNSGRSFKEVVNETLRHGLATDAAPTRRVPRFRVHPKACGFGAGVDLAKLNQFVDEREIERAGSAFDRFIGRWSENDEKGLLDSIASCEAVDEVLRK